MRSDTWHRTGVQKLFQKRGVGISTTDSDDHFWRRNRGPENVMMAAKLFSPRPRLSIQFPPKILPPQTGPPAGPMRRRKCGNVSQDFLYPTSPEGTALCYQLVEHVLLEASWPNCTQNVVLLVELRNALVALSTFLHGLLHEVSMAEHANYLSQVLCSVSDPNVHVGPLARPYSDFLCLKIFFLSQRSVHPS